LLIETVDEPAFAVATPHDLVITGDLRKFNLHPGSLDAVGSEIRPLP
jgi:hypothetical protein